MKEKFQKYFKGDPTIWIVILILGIFSLLTVYSATGTLAYKKMGGNTFYYLLKHSFFLMGGIGFTWLIHTIHYKYYYTLSQILLILSIPLLLWTLARGASLNEASRWISVPVIGLTFQTSDFAKFALIMYVARLLANKQDEIKDFKKAFWPVLWPVIAVCGLILPANFSTAAIVFATCVILMFIGRISLKYLSIFGALGITAIAIFIIVALNMPDSGRVGTWKRRIENYVSGDDKGNFQVNQAKIAIVTGGIIGKGPGNSLQRNFLPHPYSDFIYAIIIEEYGLVGGIIVLMLYIILLVRAGKIVRKCERTFPAFLVIGITISLVFQALINMAVAVNLFPVTGQTLPLVSMGGTSILFTCIGLGIILSVSRIVESGEGPAIQAVQIVNTEKNGTTN